MPVSDYVNRSSLGHIAVFVAIIFVCLLIFDALESMRAREAATEATIQLDMSEVQSAESE